VTIYNVDEISLMITYISNGNKLNSNDKTIYEIVVDWKWNPLTLKIFIVLSVSNYFISNPCSHSRRFWSIFKC